VKVKRDLFFLKICGTCQFTLLLQRTITGVRSHIVSAQQIVALIANSNLCFVAHFWDFDFGGRAIGTEHLATISTVMFSDNKSKFGFAALTL